MKKTQKNILRLCIMAMLTALSVVLVTALHFPLLPAAPFLEYDPADIPVLIGAMLLGPVHGLVILLAACIIQALTVSSGSGIIGFFMHFIASSALVLVASGIYHRKEPKRRTVLIADNTIKGKLQKALYTKEGGNILRLVLGLVAGSLAMTVVMIPLNLVFTGIFMGVGAKEVAGMLIPTIIPFNLLKAGINSVITFAVFTPVSQVLKKYTKGL